MATKQTVLTKEGLKNLENELEHLKSVTRKEIAEKIKTARGFGDLSENSEYDEAKNEQGIVEARIAEIEASMGAFEYGVEAQLEQLNNEFGQLAPYSNMPEAEKVALAAQTWTAANE